MFALCIGHCSLLWHLQLVLITCSIVRRGWYLNQKPKGCWFCYKPIGGNITISFTGNRVYLCHRRPVSASPGNEGEIQESGGGQSVDRTKNRIPGNCRTPLSFSSWCPGQRAVGGRGQKSSGAKGVLGIRNTFPGREKASMIHYQSLHGSETVFLHISQSLSQATGKDSFEKKKKVRSEEQHPSSSWQSCCR